MKALIISIWWFLALVALLFIPVVYIALNLSGLRSTWRSVCVSWHEHFKSREPWGPI